MSFPADIKGCMKDCLLAIFWPKSDIVDFLRQHGCGPAELAEAERHKELNLSRSAIVDSVFSKLSARADQGLGPYRAMLQALTSWSQFNPYYFDQLKKLDRSKADSALAHLRQLQEIRDAKIKTERAEREAREASKSKPRISIQKLKERFLTLHGGSVPFQKRGYELEEILNDLGKVAALEVTDPFRVNGEQIDGAIKYDGEHYIVEARWREAAQGNEAVYQFVAKTEGKMYGRGLFISVTGFSKDVIGSIVMGKALKTIFVDGEDLVLVLEEHLSFRDMIDRKVKAAQTRGLIYVHPITGKAKP